MTKAIRGSAASVAADPKTVSANKLERMNPMEEV
jgi:hypothetical protein